MAAEKIDVLLIGPEKPVIAKGLATFNVVKLPEPDAREKFFYLIWRKRLLGKGK